ncbi:site-specific integrase [Bradyrhizobium sp. CIAT3101]|uniref:tyrosine-type recombinase/integrase n=1 Tax=Bradyrhizobium sp. CIAT3101 TaxID=439387 RepID=UPI0024B09C33|nr:site-specific integrase [Bradyrhizobium sp. CIAT3101]WFU79398.1 site-specific integrase [Bradyrhizobium sp. CIAT3101]
MSASSLHAPRDGTIERHELMGGKCYIYKRETDSKYWQVAAYVSGKNFRSTTKCEGFSAAKHFAEEWYLELRGKHVRGELDKLVPVNAEKTFRDAAEQFLHEFAVLTEGQRSPIYVKCHERRLRKYLIPFLGDKPVSQVTAGAIQEYRLDRIAKAKATSKEGKPPARQTMHQEMVALRQTLKTALRHGWLVSLPDMSQPYRQNAKISHRAWFSPAEYRQLYLAAARRAQHPKKERYRYHGEELYDFIIFMANTGLRPDEANRLEYRDVTVVTDHATRERILEIEVRGKRGVGYCKSMPSAVAPFMRLRRRNSGKPNDRIFPNDRHVLLNAILEEEDLKIDREGQRRTAYSLRHTYICLRLMEGADIYQIAKNCRTSVEMIERYYASHIKNQLDAAAINVKRAPRSFEPQDLVSAPPAPRSLPARADGEHPQPGRYPRRKSHRSPNVT